MAYYYVNNGKPPEKKPNVFQRTWAGLLVTYRLINNKPIWKPSKKEKQKYWDTTKGKWKTRTVTEKLQFPIIWNLDFGTSDGFTGVYDDEEIVLEPADKSSKFNNHIVSLVREDIEEIVDDESFTIHMYHEPFSYDSGSFGLIRSAFVFVEYKGILMLIRKDKLPPSDDLNGLKHGDISLETEKNVFVELKSQEQLDNKIKMVNARIVKDTQANLSNKSPITTKQKHDDLVNRLLNNLEKPDEVKGNEHITILEPSEREGQ